MKGLITRTVFILLFCASPSCGAGHGVTVHPPHVQSAFDAYIHGESEEIVKQALDASLALDDRNPLLLAMAGDVAYFTGDFESSAEFFSQAVVSSLDWDDPLRDAVAEMSLASLDSMDPYAPGYEATLGELHEDTLPGLYTSTDAAYFVALKSRIRWLARAGRFEDSRALMQQGGCLTKWRATGPFGQTELLHYDDHHPPESDFPWKTAYQLRPGTDPTATFEASSFYCNVSIEPDDSVMGGTYYAATDLSVKRSGRYVFRLYSPHTTTVIMDGADLLTVDRRYEYEPSVVLFTVDLSRGEHRLTLKLGTRDSMPGFSMMVKEASSTSPDPGLENPIVSRSHGQGFSALAPPPAGARRIAMVEPGSDLEAFLASETALVRGNSPRARTLLEPLFEEHPSSLTLLTRSMTIALNDPFVPYALRMNRLRVLTEEAIRAHPTLWPAHMLLARLEAGQDRTEKALDVLENAIQVAGDVPGFHVQLADLYASKGWVGESVASLSKAAELLEGNCNAHRHEMRIAETFGDLDGVEHWASQVVACDATDTALFEILMRREKFEQAALEQKRLQGLFPDQDSNLLDDAAMDLTLGHRQAYMDNLLDYHELHPTSYLALAKLVDEHVAAGDRGEAIDLLEKARVGLDGPTDDISQMIAFIEGTDYLYPFRRDALTSIAAYEAVVDETSQPATPSVEILDHVTHRIFRDGSSLTRYHSVRKLLTKEGVEENSEFIAPPGAAVIQLRTIKADGRMLTPESIAHKMTISFPFLEPGDYTEAEWIQAVGPSYIYDGGFSLDRWYFQILDLVLHLSEMIVVAPAEMPLEINPRGTPPPVQETTQGPLKILRWTAHDMPHRKAEPGAPNLSEFLPSLQLSHNTSWERYFQWIADMLVDRNVASPALKARVAELVQDIDEDDVQGRARAIFRWVNDEIDEGDGLDTPVSYILEERMGNRARLLHVMLREAGVPSELWLVRTAHADHTKTQIPSFNVYTKLLVKVGDDWLLPFARTTPYGALPFDVRGEKAVRLFPDRAHDLTPGQDRFDDAHSRHLDITVLPSGRSKVRLTETYRGINAAMMRVGLDSLPEAELDKAIETAYLAAMFNGASLTSLSLPDLEADDDEMTLEIAFTLPAMPGPVPGAIALGPFLKSYLSKIWTSLPKRNFPLLVEEPTDAEVHVVVDTGGKWTVFQPPSPSTELSTSTGARFVQTVEDDEDELVLEREIHVPAGRISPEDYGEFLDFTTKVDETEGGVFILMKTELSALME